MELNDIQKLMQTFNDMGFNRLQYSNGGESLLLEKGAAPAAPMAAPVQTAPVVHAVPQTAQPQPEVRVMEAARPAEDSKNLVKAPMVGVFYPAPSPDAQDYVQVGQRVTKGQTLCILEAMKVLNEIQAEWDGIVEDVLVKPEDIVEYGQPLFRIRRA